MPNLKEKVLNCFKAAEIATGASLKYEWVCIILPPFIFLFLLKYLCHLQIDKPYDDLSTNPTLADLYTKNLASLGFTMPDLNEQRKYPQLAYQ